MTTLAVIRAFARLRWRLLASSLAGRGTERLGATAVTAVATASGTIGFTALAIAGPRVDDPATLMTAVMVGITIGAVGLGIVTGVSRPIDPRVIAVEPLSLGDRSIGLLVATAVGPPGLAAVAIGAGAVVGLVRGPLSMLTLVPAVVLWLLVLLLAARTSTELLTLLVRRAPRAGYVLVGLAGLGLWTLVQLGPAVLAGMSATERARLAELAAWTPVGQLAVAMTADAPGAAILPLGIGALTVVLLAGLHLGAVHRSGTDAGVGPDRRPTRSRTVPLADRLVGRGAVGAVTRRQIKVRFRRPRTALETVAAAGIGMAAVLAPIALRDDPAGGAVLLGGAVHLAVLLVAGNSFGNEGPAVVHDLVAGGPRLLVAGTVRSTVVITAPLAVLGPLAAAALTGAWHLLPAGWLVAAGALLAGAGGAVVQSVLVPIPLPEGDDPFATGESGRNLAAGLAMLGVLVVLAVAMSPIVLALMWATSAGATATITGLTAAGVVAGWGLCRVGSELAVRRLERATPAFVTALAPAR